MVAIGASTGGPPALAQILSALPRDFAAPILLVQHLPAGFGEGFAQWLGSTTGLPVHVARSGVIPLPGHVYVCPDDHHLRLGPRGELLTSRDEPRHGLRPSVGVLFESVAERLGPKAIGVLLTGMGQDGAAELKLLADRDALTIAQDADSCVVFGMPAEAIKLEAARFVLSPPAIAEFLTATVKPGGREGAKPWPGTPAATGRPVTILIVEDSPTQLQQLRLVLDEAGFAVVTATNGREGLAAARSRPIDLVISDVVMPELDGYGLCRALGADPQLCHVPVILLTWLGDPHDVVRALAAGARHFLCKPYDDDALVARVRRVLANQELRQQEAARGEAGTSVMFAGRSFLVTADRAQILDLLLSTYEDAVQRNAELVRARDELRAANEELVARRAGHQEAERSLRVATGALAGSTADLEQFASVASHDLQEPLRLIASYLQLLQKRFADHLDREAIEFITFAVDAARRMKALIDDLLAYSRVGRTGPVFTRVDSGEVADRAIASLQAAIAQAHGVVTRSELPVVIADSALLSLLFGHLIGNALKFRGETPPVVDISVVRQPATDERVFAIKDNGMGMEAQYFERIFRLFQRLHGPGQFAGTGVGLALCKKIVERHHGRIWVESELGKGSTFYFTLPAA